MEVGAENLSRIKLCAEAKDFVRSTKDLRILI